MLCAGIFEGEFCRPGPHSRDARGLERCQVICRGSILSPGPLCIPESCLPLPSPCRAAPQGKVLAKVAAGIHQALQRNLGRDRGTTGMGGRMPKVPLGCQPRSWNGCGGGDRGGVWPQMETGAALTIFGSCMGQGKAQGGFPSLCASIPENRRGFLSVHLLPLPTTREHPRSTRPSAVLHGEHSWSPSTHLHLSRGSPIC